MSVVIDSVEKNSPAQRAGIVAGETLVSLNGEEIIDVLDYRFYQENKKIKAEILGANGKLRTVRIKKDEYEELGLEFATYLMDNKHSCRNKCIFCFIDQLPKGLRESLYFKDDDSRLSFLFGNYITLTNITEHEISRIIKMHISPINISVHTTNPELRVRMMKNKNAGKVLDIIPRLNAVGIKINCQLVLCPGFNDGAELERTLSDLTGYENIECIAAVPVGLTKFREGLERLEPFNRETAAAVIDTMDKFGDKCLERYGDRRAYAADEFYLISKRPMPPASYYGDFLQLENGVGMWAMMKADAENALLDTKPFKRSRHISLATGMAAYPLIKEIALRCEEKVGGLKCDVFAIKNNFFGERITVAGLVTATDIYDQLKGKELGEELLLPSVMLRTEGDMFLDSVTLEELSEKLNIKITPIDCDGYGLVGALTQEGSEQNV